MIYIFGIVHGRYIGLTYIYNRIVHLWERHALLLDIFFDIDKLLTSWRILSFIRWSLCSSLCALVPASALRSSSSWLNWDILIITCFILLIFHYWRHTDSSWCWWLIKLFGVHLCNFCKFIFVIRNWGFLKLWFWCKLFIWIWKSLIYCIYWSFANWGMLYCLVIVMVF